MGEGGHVKFYPYKEERRKKISHAEGSFGVICTW